MNEEQEFQAPYDAFYFAHSCGIPYERNSHWLEFFGTIADHIVRGIAPKRVLDIGCAFGFLVEALRDRDVEAFGIDISEHAVSQVRDDIRPFCRLASATRDIPENYDLMVCIEVLEHLESRDALIAIANMCSRAPDIIFSSTPKDYSEATHINVHPMEYWVEAFAKHGFLRDLDFDASFIAPQAMRFRSAKDPLFRQIAAYERVLGLRVEEISQLRRALMSNEERLARLESGPRPVEDPGLAPTLYLDYGSGFTEDSAIMIESPKHPMGAVDWKVNVEQPVRALRLDPAVGAALVSDFRLEITRDGTPIQIGRANEQMIGAVRLGTSSILAVEEDPQLIWNYSLRRGDVIHFRFHYRTLNVREIGDLLDTVVALVGEYRSLHRLAVRLRASRWQWKRRAQMADKRVKRHAEGLKQIHAGMQELRETLHDANKMHSQLENALAEVSALKIQLAAADREALALRTQVDALRMSLSWRLTHPFRMLRNLIRGFSPIRAWAWPRRQEAIPGPDVERSQDPDTWVSKGDDPWFRLEGPFPAGWVEISYRLRTGATRSKSRIYIDYGQGYNETRAVSLPVPDQETGNVRHAFCLIREARAIRLDPVDEPGTFYLESMQLRPISKWRLAKQVCRSVLKSHTISFGTVIRSLQRGGIAGIKSDVWNAYISMTMSAGRTYAEWVDIYDTLTDKDVEQINEHIQTMHHKPLISVIMPVYNVEPRWLRAAVESVRKQIYPNWQLCIADDASSSPDVGKMLEAYRQLDNRIKVTFRERNGHISAASNSALALATGEYIALLDHDDELAPHALYLVANELNSHPDAVLLYSDEDKIDESGRRMDPYFKPDWNLDLFLGQNMISHLGVYRTDVVRSIGGFRGEFEGSQDYDLALRAVERIGADRIRHIPRVLYHWRTIKGSTATSGAEKSYALNSARSAVQAYCDRNDMGAVIEACPTIPYYHRAVFQGSKPPPLVSVVIATRNGVGMLKECIESVRGSDYAPIEIIVVDNASDEVATLTYLAGLQGDGVIVLSYPGEFNYSAINNYAVQHARGDMLLFMNNDVKALDSAWLTEMVSHALRPNVGVVGAALYYPDGTLQHGGVILGVGGIANHAHHLLRDRQAGYFGRAKLTQEFCAVTGACMLVRRDVFEMVGGFDEKHLPVAFNDVDLCLKIRRRGLVIVWTPNAQLLHCESATRSRDMSAAERQREVSYMLEKWSEIISNDPYYNPNLSLDRADFGLAWPPRTIQPWSTFEAASELATGRRHGRQPRKPEQTVDE